MSREIREGFRQFEQNASMGETNESQVCANMLRTLANVAQSASANDGGLAKEEAAGLCDLVAMVADRLDAAAVYNDSPEQ